jgi:hypothetical protein
VIRNSATLARSVVILGCAAAFAPARGRATRRSRTCEPRKSRPPNHTPGHAPGDPTGATHLSRCDPDADTNPRRPSMRPDINARARRNRLRAARQHRRSPRAPKPRPHDSRWRGATPASKSLSDNATTPQKFRAVVRAPVDLSVRFRVPRPVGSRPPGVHRPRERPVDPAHPSLGRPSLADLTHHLPDTSGESRPGWEPNGRASRRDVACLRLVAVRRLGEARPGR